jgi:uncharacterized secreted protein with C-terminal beta-propeller domain
MLLKDLFKIYKVLECYNMEVLERFSSLTVEGGGEDLAKKAIELFQNFLKTTKDIEKKSVDIFNFSVENEAINNKMKEIITIRWSACVPPDC